MKAIFITGAAAGIGRATALKFASEGWRVGLYDVDGVGVQQLADEIGHEKAQHGVLDVRDADSFKEVMDDFLAFSGGRLDVLFNNAGLLRQGMFDEIPLDQQHLLVDVNIKGVLNGIHAGLPHLKRTAKTEGRAVLMTMSSAAAIYGVPEQMTYAATKHAVRGITEGMDLELARDGITVTDIMPSYVDTGMIRNQERPAFSLKEAGAQHTAEDIADLAWKAAHEDKLHHLANASLKRSQFLVRMMPNFGRKLMGRLMPPEG